MNRGTTAKEITLCESLFPTLLEEVNQNNIRPISLFCFDFYLEFYKLISIEKQPREQVEQAYRRIQPFFPIRIQVGSNMETDICKYAQCGRLIFTEYAVRCQVDQKQIFCSFECLLSDWILVSTSSKNTANRFKLYADLNVQDQEPPADLDYLDDQDMSKFMDFFSYLDDIPETMRGDTLECGVALLGFTFIRALANGLLLAFTQEKEMRQRSL